MISALPRDRLLSWTKLMLCNLTATEDRLPPRSIVTKYEVVDQREKEKQEIGVSFQSWWMWLQQLALSSEGSWHNLGKNPIDLLVEKPFWYSQSHQSTVSLNDALVLEVWNVRPANKIQNFLMFISPKNRNAKKINKK